MSEAPTLPRRSAVLAICLAVHLLGLLSGLLYVVVLTEDSGVDMRSYPSANLALAHLVGTLVVGAWAWRMSAPLGRLRVSLSAGQPAGSLPLDDVRQAITMHQRAWVYITATHVLGAPLLTLVAWASGWHEEPLASHMLSMSVLEGLILGVVTRYSMQTWLARRVTPILLAHGDLARLPELRLTSVYAHLAVLLFLLVGVLPLSALLLQISGFGTVKVFLVLYAHFIWTSALVGGLVMYTISSPVHRLERDMARVGGGALDVQARITAPDTLGAMASHFNAMVRNLAAQAQLRELFGRYLTREVAEEILAGRVPLGGERKVATVVFADIHGFTAMAEEMRPEAALALLNRYLGAMAEEVIRHGGTLDKFLGDAVMALFGVPVSQGSVGDDARAAVACAWAMSEALDRLNNERRAEGLQPVELGIGVATGELVAGNIGTEKRMDYTAIGDTVNLASRLQGLTRRLGRRIVINERAALLLNEALDEDESFNVRVRGRREKVRVFVLGPVWSPGRYVERDETTITFITDP
ncbi:MAG: adenylate/guanylate cyclase domain-containing protein [Alphaproteobacteria bacterium]|nr:adenylate/guanylate cyclase domain-containing protein [Alphaproteobacteria bacterium]MCB9794954.1 adenylate/guanylate cyclase domain-containing protein [Alphaproteobacteria bacterium]